MSPTSPHQRHRPSPPSQTSLHPSWPAPTPSRTTPHSAGALQLRAVIAFAVSAALIGLVGVYVGVVKLPTIGEDQKHDDYLSSLPLFSTLSNHISHRLIYFIPLLIPVTAYFVIANWVGWQYFRYA